MFAAIDDVHHRCWQQPCTGSTEIPVQRLRGEVGGCLGDSQRNAQNCVSAELLFVGRAVQFDHVGIDARLIQAVPANQFRSNLVIDVLHGLRDALAQVNLLVPVAQFPSFVSPGAGAAGYGGSTKRTVRQHHINFDGGITSTVQDLAAVNIGNDAHGYDVFLLKSVLVNRVAMWPRFRPREKALRPLQSMATRHNESANIAHFDLSRSAWLAVHSAWT